MPRKPSVTTLRDLPEIPHAPPSQDELFNRLLQSAAVSQPQRALDAGRSEGARDPNTRWIPVDEVYAMGFGSIDTGTEPKNPFFYNPRDSEELADEDIATLIRNEEESGQIFPIIVRRTARGYELIDGERRLNWHKVHGRTQIYARIVNADNLGALQIVSEIETKKKSHSPLARGRLYLAMQWEMQHQLDTVWLSQAAPSEVSKRGKAKMTTADWEALYRRWQDAPGWVLEVCENAERSGKPAEVTAVQIAKIVSEGERMVQDLMNIAQAPAELQDLVKAGKLPLNRARIAAALPEPEQQVALARKIVRAGLTPEQARDAGRALKWRQGPKGAAGPSTAITDLRKAVSLVASARKRVSEADGPEARKLVALIQGHCAQIAGE